MEFPPFTHVYRFGQDCTLETFGKWISGQWPTVCPFTYTLMPDLESCVDLLLEEGSYGWNMEDFCMIPYKEPWDIAIQNRVTGQLFIHDVFPITENFTKWKENFSEIRLKQLTQFLAMRSVLNNPEHRVLILWIGYGDMYKNLYGHASAYSGHRWYDFNMAQRCANKLNSNYRAAITLLYLDIEKYGTNRPQGIRHVAADLIAGTHCLHPYSSSNIRGTIMAAMFGRDLRKAVGDHIFPSFDEVEENDYIIPVKTPQWYDVVAYNGRRGCRLKGQHTFDVKALYPDRVKVKWDAWGEETFEKVGDVNFPLWKKVADK